MQPDAFCCVEVAQYCGHGRRFIDRTFRIRQVPPSYVNGGGEKIG
jgi:hypothetical protein